MKITDKDWSRMTDLVLTGKDGTGVAKVIKNKDKAIARFVAGVKLDGSELSYSELFKEYCTSFSEFGNKALELGATLKEIQEVYDENEVPTKFTEKLATLANKKLRNRFVGDLSKKILDAGYDINYLPHNGNAITMIGKDAMARNGRKWTIGYKAEIDLGSKKVNLVFDAITDEGFGPTAYFISIPDSNPIFRNSYNWETMGKLKFIKSVMESLKK